MTLESSSKGMDVSVTCEKLCANYYISIVNDNAKKITVEYKNDGINVFGENLESSSIFLIDGANVHPVSVDMITDSIFITMESGNIIVKDLGIEIEDNDFIRNILYCCFNTDNDCIFIYQLAS